MEYPIKKPCSSHRQFLHLFTSRDPAGSTLATASRCTAAPHRWSTVRLLTVLHMASTDSYPLVNIQKAIENGHRNSEFSHEKW
jgi:hypothetical protein